MKKVISILLASFMIMSLMGCYSVKIVAPSNNNVKLLSETDTVNFKKCNRNWFALWGLVPIGNNDTSKVIADNGLTKVRVETRFSFVDYLISFIGSYVSIVANTSVIEGNK